MRLLVTGSNGLLGQKITDLVLTNYPSVDLACTGKGKNRYPSSSDYSYYTLDITNKNQVKDVLSDFSPQVIIHTAAATNVDWCELHPKECNQINIDGTKNIAIHAQQIGAHLVHLSTDFIFDGNKAIGQMYLETDTPNPVSHYGHSKLKAEQMVQQNCTSWAILRTVLVYGVVHDMSRSNVVLWVKNKLENHEAIKVVTDQYRTPTLAEDLAKGCLLVAEQSAQGVFNISGKNYMHINALAHQVAQVFNLDNALIGESDSRALNQAAQRPPKTGFNIQKAIDILGYSPLDFNDGLALVKDQIQENSRP